MEQTNVRYIIRRLPDDCERLALEGEFFPGQIPAPWDKTDEAKLIYPYRDRDGDYTPACAARVGWNKKGIHVLMYAQEPVIRAEETHVGGNIYLDSCLEFFLAPGKNSLNYVNCEVNPMAVMHIGVGEGRQGRTVFTTLPDGFHPVHSEHKNNWWAISYTIPADFLMKYFDFAPASGAPVRGNFYNCGDKDRRPHYGMFLPYDLEKPDYHRPELFADMILE